MQQIKNMDTHFSRFAWLSLLFV